MLRASALHCHTLSGAEYHGDHASALSFCALGSKLLVGRAASGRFLLEDVMVRNARRVSGVLAHHGMFDK